MLLTVVGVLLAIPPFLPWISVSTETTLDPTDPFATPFIVYNEGYLPIYNVRVVCHTNRLVTDPRHTGDQWDVTGFRSVRSPMLDKIDARGRVTSECWPPINFTDTKT